MRQGLLAGGDAQFAVKAGERNGEYWIQNPHATRNILLLEIARQGQCDAFAGLAALGGSVLHVQTAHPGFQAGGRNDGRVADADFSRMRRASDDRADAGEREAAVDSEPEAAHRRALMHRGGRSLQVCAQRGDAFPRAARQGENRAAGEPCAGDERFDFLPGLVEPLQRDGIDLGQRNRPARQAQQVEQFEMFARLRHRPVVGGDHQQDEVDAGHAGEHVVDQFFVPRHVDEAEHRAIGKGGVGVAEVEGDAAGLFLGQPIGIHAGERLHQRGLAVVDVACGADQHGIKP